MPHLAYLWDDFVLFISRLGNNQIYWGPALCFANLLLTKKKWDLQLTQFKSSCRFFFRCFGIEWGKGNRNSICVATHHFILKAKTQYILAFIFLGTGFWHLSLLHRYSLAQNCPKKEIYNTRKKCSFSLNLESSRNHGLTSCDGSDMTTISLAFWYKIPNQLKTEVLFST